VSTPSAFITRLTTRTLVTYDSKPGKEGVNIVPDMATDLGKSSNGGKTWTFTLKDGVKFDDGSPVTCADVKYGVSRAFSSQITDGPHYPHQYLDLEEKEPGSPVYRDRTSPGPNGNFDKAVECTDEKTIVFTLKKVVGDFNNSLTWPVWAPVPRAGTPRPSTTASSSRPART
jgi:peptide/nickel transport system substrate-binding protein